MAKKSGSSAKKSKTKKSSGKKPSGDPLEKKEEILAFVKNFDAEHGRGGASAAVKKFGVGQSTISYWKITLSGVETTEMSKNAELFSRMANILDEISELETRNFALEREYTKLRKKIQIE